ncbi:trans-aconitate 2-methyltransferase [Anaeramoeba flamelloides]|uniref:Trans-aconitate 2-methyltransferase n=1 Tax=Anaeramoeba flamelloides TaxID=1746091 RepID=A0AAV8ADW4_9EUKA|nr:trans-aconitate 2-methyltransferase [Anaeramoeba flamelloides]
MSRTKITREFFDQVSQKWDNIQKIKLGNKISTIFNKNVNELFTKEKLTVLDFGAGTLTTSIPLVLNNDRIEKLYAVDISEKMLEKGKKKLEDLNNTEFSERFELKAIDLTTETEFTEKVDVVVSSMAFHHLKEPKKMLPVLKSLLKENGCIMFVDYTLTETSYYFHPVELREAVLPGFETEKVLEWLKELDCQKHSCETFFHFEKPNKVENEPQLVEFDLFLALAKF